MGEGWPGRSLSHPSRVRLLARRRATRPDLEGRRSRSLAYSTTTRTARDARIPPAPVTDSFTDRPRFRTNRRSCAS